MANDYILIVGRKDQERFRRFRTGYDRDIIKSIGALSEADNIWALGPATEHGIWSSIQRDDRVFLAEAGMPFRHCGVVLSKVTDRSHAVGIWGDTPRMREHERIILFSAVHDMDVTFSKLCNRAGINPLGDLTNIYPAKNDIGAYVPIHEEITGSIIVSDDGTPDKKSEVVTRFIRDTKKVKQLKAMYHDECQVCGHTIAVSEGSRYSEVHHIYPLGDGGSDDLDNMLVLCPTHHVEFDYKVIGIDSDKKTIVDKNGNKVGDLTMASGHTLNDRNIRFHLMRMGMS